MSHAAAQKSRWHGIPTRYGTGWHTTSWFGQNDLSRAPTAFSAAMNRLVRPSPDQIAPLSRMERVAFQIADFLAQPKLSPISKSYNTVVMGSLLWACGSRRFHMKGLEHLAPYGKKDSILFVANHRSFFDFFSVTAAVYWRTNLTRRIFFPVRQTFFYDHPLGPPVNLFMSGMRMFPPMMRDKGKRAFNQYSVARCIEELNREDIGTVMGLHPEGTRGKGADPYTFLPAQPGVGRIALGATRATVIPIFLLGMGQSIPGEMKVNLLAPAEHPVDLYFGPPIDFRDLRSRASDPEVQLQASQRCIDAIRAVSEIHRRDVDARSGRPPAELPQTRVQPKPARTAEVSPAS